MAVITALVNNRAQIGFTQEASEFLERNDLDSSDIVRGFRGGSVLGPVKPGEENEWECSVVAPILGGRAKGRAITILTVVIQAKSLLVGRVSWVNERET